MKKLLFSLSALASLAIQVSAASAYINLNDFPSTSPFNLASETDTYVLTGARPDYSVWLDAYIAPSVSSFNQIVASTGSIGWHSNVHITLNETNNLLASSNFTPFSFNDSPMGGESGNTVALGYYLESSDNSAVKFIFSNDTGATINLATTDCDGNGNKFGKNGRTFSVGENVTMESVAINVKDKLTTSQTEYTDSMFEVAGTVASTTSSINFNNTNFNIASTGLITSGTSVSILNNTVGTIAGELKSVSVMNIDSGSNVTVSGKINAGITEEGSGSGINVHNATLTIAESGEVYSKNTMYIKDGAIVNINGTLTGSGSLGLGGIGSVVTVGETGWLKYDFVMKGSELIVNGKLTKASGITGNTIDVSADSKISFGANASYAIAGINLAGGSITVGSDATVTTLRIFENNVGSFNVEDGHTLTTSNSNFYAGSTVDLNGNVNFLTNLYAATASTVVNINGTVIAGEGIQADVASGSALSNNGTIIINNGGTLHLKSYNAGGWSTGNVNNSGNIVVDGGTLKVFSNKTDSYSLLITKTISLTNDGALENVNEASHIAMQSGELSFDTTSKLLAKTFVLTGTSDKKITFTSAANLPQAVNFKVVRSNGNKILLCADNTFNLAKIEFHDTNIANDITFDLNGGKLNIDGLGVMSKISAGTVIFEDFVLNSVKISGLTTELISSGTFTIGQLTATLKGYDVYGNLLGGTWGVDSYGYLFNSALVPEPADFAVIFGALAIAFTIYRRRK